MTDRPESSTDERGRRAFIPTLVMGVPAAIVAAVGANKPLVSSPVMSADMVQDLGEVPLAGGLALLPLLAWVALLLLRGQWRLAPALVGLAGAVGTIAAADAGLAGARGRLEEEFVSRGLSDLFMTEQTGWFWVTLVAALLSALAFAVALRHARLWPTMSRRYDAPSGAGAAGATAAEPSTNQELWKAIDEGRDPTATDPTDDN